MLIPLSDENEDYDVPVVNYLILFICIAVFIYEITLSPKEFEFFLRAFGFSSHDYVAGARGLQKFLGAFRAVFDPFRTGWVTAITALFLHGGFMHIAGNLFFLWIFGDNVEHVMGRARYAAFYLLCGMLANFSQALMGADADVPCIGASGAISAVMGAYLVFYPRAIINMCFFWSIYQEPVYFRMRAWMYLVFFFLMQMLTGVLTWGDKYFEVAVWAHIGGFLSGLLLAYPFKDPFFLFKEEGEKMLGLDGAGRTGDVDTHHEFMMAIGRRAGWRGEADFGPASRKFHRRPPLKEMRRKGKAERDETIKKRGW